MSNKPSKKSSMPGNVYKADNPHMLEEQYEEEIKEFILAPIFPVIKEIATVVGDGFGLKNTRITQITATFPYMNSSFNVNIHRVSFGLHTSRDQITAFAYLSARAFIRKMKREYETITQTELSKANKDIYILTF